ncbi:MAG: ABC transporter permease [Candidatus Cyclobacteriaceae bacterium M2_1C_046]
MSKKYKVPPIAERLLVCLIRSDIQEEVLGDLEEKYQKKAQKGSVLMAKADYWYQVIKYMRPFALKSFQFHNSNFISMHKSHFKIAWRNIVRHKGFSLINISGLAIGMAVAILIGLWIHHELTYNRHYNNYKHIAKVLQNQDINGETVTWGSQALQLGPVLKDEYGAHFEHVVMGSWTGEHILTHGTKTISSSGNYLEPAVSEMLSLEMIYGTREGLNNPNTILISYTTSRALFGHDNPIGEVVSIDNKYEVTVKGVYTDIPEDASFNNLHFIAPFELYVAGENLQKRVGWGNSWFQCYVQIKEDANMTEVSSIIADAKLINVDEEEKRFNPQLFLHPMSKWRLYSDFENGIATGGRIEYVRLFATIGIFVLMLACINFMNLSTARAEKRGKEIGIKKAMGSLRSQLISQFLLESIVLSFFALIFALLLVHITLPLFSIIVDENLSLLWKEPIFWIACLFFSLFTGILAGSYPALFMSSLNIIKTLKGGYLKGAGNLMPRKILVVLQFTISIILIVGTAGVYKQINYVKNRPIGYEKENLISIPMRTSEVRQNYDKFKHDLITGGFAEQVSQSEDHITDMSTTNGGFIWAGKDPNMQDEIVTMGTGFDFGETINWELIEGRDFSHRLASDSLGFILNEAAVNYMGLNDPIGEKVKAFGREYTIIGVVKNMITQSLFESVRPMIFYIDSFGRLELINIKLPGNIPVSEALNGIEKIYKKHNSSTPFSYEFADQQFALKYKDEKQVGELAGTFALFAILISCMGLFGMSVYSMELRIKEISIRKVLGAPIFNLWSLLTKDFVVLIAIACVIALPLSHFVLENWLEQYGYKTDLPWWIFASAGLVSVLIATLVISFQTLKTALINPVETLKE